jgi:hypothetical protein
MITIYIKHSFKTQENTDAAIEMMFEIHDIKEKYNNAFHEQLKTAVRDRFQGMLSYLENSIKDGLASS